MVIFAVLLKARAEVPGPILLATPKAGVQRRIKILEKRFMRIPNGSMSKTICSESFGTKLEQIAGTDFMGQGVSPARAAVGPNMGFLDPITNPLILNAFFWADPGDANKNDSQRRIGFYPRKAFVFR